MLSHNSEHRDGRVGVVRPFMRSLLAFCALVFFVSSTAPYIAPAHPYLKRGVRTGYFSRIRKASEVGVERAGEIAIADKPPRLVEPPSQEALSLDWETPLAKVPRPLRAYRFRPPPLH